MIETIAKISKVNIDGNVFFEMSVICFLASICYYFYPNFNMPVYIPTDLSFVYKFGLLSKLLANIYEVICDFKIY